MDYLRVPAVDNGTVESSAVSLEDDKLPTLLGHLGIRVGTIVDPNITLSGVGVLEPTGKWVFHKSQLTLATSFLIPKYLDTRSLFHVFLSWVDFFDRRFILPCLSTPPLI